MTRPLLPGAIRGALASACVGRRLYYYPETDSTNNRALDLARAGEPEGAVVYTDFQRRGRGRHGRRWESRPRRDLLFSVVLRPPGETRGALAVTLAVSVAVAVAVSKAIGVEVGVDWPNDVVTPEGKIAGILAEGASSGGRATHAVVGVGINVNSSREELPPDVGAASCRTLTGAEIDRARLFADVLGTIDTFYQRFRFDGFDAMIDAYEERLVILDRDVAVSRGGNRVRAHVLGVATDGALRVRIDGNTETLYSESVTIWE